ncbi:hypothetical protein MP228_006224 [Amoeboaphelidium protococcarum]|nr:hypothetical protein MP228_006224 [Amoeboaphelidium protococcarum]
MRMQGLRWYDIKYRVRERFRVRVTSRGLRDETTYKSILKGVDGHVEPGELVAIIGASGSGKTSLLNALSGRVTHGEVDGLILADGRPRSRNWRHQHGYVEQFETFQEHLTVKETLSCHAMLRLSKLLDDDIKKRRVKQLLMQLGLSGCSNTLIQNLSGGERRRTALAMELISSPSMIFADEITSGLDAFTALSIIELLKRMAETEQKAILITIHQPRNLIMKLIDRVMLLSQGEQVYFGKMEGAIEFFQSCGITFNQQESTQVDFLLDCTTVDSRNEESTTASQQTIDHLKMRWSEQRTQDITGPEALLVEDGDATPTFNEWKSRPSAMRQCQILTWRFLTDYRRYKSALIAFGVQTLALAIAVSIIFYNMGTGQSSVQSRIGLIFFIVTQEMFGFVMPLSVALPREKKMITRERWSVSYRVSSLYMAKVISILPQALIGSFVFSLIVYWATGMQQDPQKFLIFLTIVITLVLCAQALGMIFGSLIKDLQVALIVSPMVVLIMIVFAGNVVSSDQITPALRWVSYISPPFYAYNALMRNEMTGLSFACSESPTTTLCFQTGEQVLEYFDITALTIWECLIYMWILIVSFHVIGYFALRFTTQPRIKSTSQIKVVSSRILPVDQV